MEPILVGVDGSRSGERALTWATGAAGELGAELLLACAVPHGTDRMPIEEQLLVDWSAPVQRSRLAFRTEVVEGPPGPALEALAADVRPGLVVVGSGHERWFPALHLGSASHHLAQAVDAPLCIVPLDKAGFAASQIVVGVDGSPSSQAAARWAAQVALRCGGKVTAVHAWQHSSTHMTNVAAGVNDQAAAEQACRDWTAPLADAGVLAGVIVAEGVTCEVLARGVAEVGAGILVLGGRPPGRRLGIAPLCALEAGVAPTVLVKA